MQPIIRLNCFDDRIEATYDDALFTAYRFAGVPARPCFWPVCAPGDLPVTRDWPMIDNNPDETRDHIHHRSIWTAYGDVNGADNWSEEPGHGRTVHRSIQSVQNEPDHAQFEADSDWLSSSGERIIAQKMRVVFSSCGADARIMDLDIRLIAADKDVHFGDTKEGGIVSVRVATSMDGDRGGLIDNSEGETTEAQTWGHAAKWCRYSGTVHGASVSITVMDHPTSFRFPTRWHVRDYGLMAANPFALSAYTGGIEDGSHLLPRGEEMNFHYRVAVCSGNWSVERLNEIYQDYVK